MPAAKRVKTDNSNADNSPGGSAGKPNPSFVVHARNLPENCTQAEIIKSLDRYGLISFIELMPKKRQALIEFCEIDSAMDCVNDANRNNILIGGQSAYLNYSNNQKIDRNRFVIYFYLKKKLLWARIRVWVEK
jgi:RNA recognition motif-containing protein